MDFLNWKYTASDIADWFDAEDEKYWNQHDEWLIQTQLRGETNAVFVFASWYSDRMNTLPQRINSSLASGVMDVLRLGNDFDFSSSWGIAKGTFLNLTRVATIAGPISKAVAMGGRYSGILATSGLQGIPLAEGPCAFVMVNNVLSYMRGRSIQLFAVVEDIIAVRGANKGIGREALLASEQVQAALAKYGITWESRAGMRTIDDVLRAAQATEGPIAFGIKWTKDGITARHALTAVKDASGSVRILDYVDESVDAFKGFGSMADMVRARPQWGAGFANAVLNLEAPVQAFSSQYLKLLQFADGAYRFGVPIAMGLRWTRGNSLDDKIFDIARSVWRFLRANLEDSAPTPPTPSKPPPAPATAPTIPTAPDTSGNRLGVSPLPPEASGAPRIDWLTGVQHRLRYLGYYKGAIHGNNDQATKNAVLAFQKDWFTDAREWDSIPGPITQAMLYSALGW